MKKVLAVLSSALLLISSLCCGIVLTSAAEAPTEQMFFDFSTQAAYDDVVDGKAGNCTDRTGVVPGTDASVPPYNNVLSAMEVTFAGRTNTAIIDIYNSTNTVKLADASVLAVKVRLGSTYDSALANFRQVRLFYNDGTTNQSLYVKAQPTLQNSNGWQLLLFDVNCAEGTTNLTTDGSTAFTADATTGEYPLSQFRFMANGAATYYIQWAGFFASESAACDYYNTNTTGFSTGAFMDFATKTSYDDIVGGKTVGSTDNTAVVGKNATYTYDETINAMDVTYSAAGAYMDFINSTKPAKVSQTSVLALKVKLDTTSIVNGYSQMFSQIRLFTSTGPSGVGTNVNLYVRNYGYLQPTADWQLLLIDVSSKGETSNLYTDGNTPWSMSDAVSNYHFSQFRIMARNSVSYHIEWAGFFADEQDAKAYYAATTEATGLVDDGKACNQSKDSLAFRFKMTANGVGYADPAAAAANTNFSRAALDGATMVIDGAERTVTDYGMLLSTVAGTEKADLTAYSVTGAKVRKVPAAKLYDAGTGWVQFAVLVKGITAHADNEVFARAYVEYTDANGDTAYAYSDIISTTLNEAIKEVG